MNASAQGQRLDQWLWHARFFKTRSLASKFVAAGGVRVSRDDVVTRGAKPSFAVRRGDVLVFARSDRVRVIEIADTAARRGPASEAQALYVDHSPPRPPRDAPPQMPFEREKGAGRPTKKDRRALSALRGGPE